MTQEQEEILATVKKTDLGVLLTLLSLCIGAVYGYSSLTQKVSGLAEVVQELRTDLKTMQGNRYTSTDAVRDLSRIQDGMSRMESRITEIEKCETYKRCSSLGGK
jgi:hypothetical protein